MERSTTPLLIDLAAPTPIPDSIKDRGRSGLIPTPSGCIEKVARDIRARSTEGVSE
jgi:hypothetical protein